MIAYGFSIQGKSHIEHGTICQDYNKHLALRGGWYLGVVADGVGSAAHSNIGSRTAVENLCEYCKKHLEAKMSEEELEDMLCSGYEYAFEAVLRYAEDAADAIEEYDTTLSSALYNGDHVIYGHAGDGGILIRLCDGQIKPITKRQKGIDGCSVIPLRAGISSWNFGIVKEKIAAVLLATDGMLDGVFQPVLLNLPSDVSSLARGDFSNDHAYITVSEFFMNPDAVYQNPVISDADAFVSRYLQGDLEKGDEKPFLNCIWAGYRKMLDKEEVMELCDGIAKYYYAVWALTNVTDDKSVVCMMNEKAKVFPQKMEYYQEPNWKLRQGNYHVLLYGDSVAMVPYDDLSGGNRKNQEHVKRFDKYDNGIGNDLPEAETEKIRAREDSESTTRLVSKRETGVTQRQRAVLLEEQKEREKHWQQYLDLQRKKKRKIASAVVAVLVFCLLACGISGIRRSMNHNWSGNQEMVSPTRAISSLAPSEQVPKETDSISVDNSNALPAPWTDKENDFMKKKAEKFVVELKEKELYTSLKKSKQGEEREGKESEENIEQEKDMCERNRDNFQKKLKEMKLDKELSNFLASTQSEDKKQNKNLALSSEENASDQIEKIIRIIDDEKLEALVDKEDFAHSFVGKIKEKYGEKDEAGREKIVKNLKVLLDGISEN